MKKLAAVTLLTLMAIPLAASAETWKDAPLVDVMCSAKAKPNPAVHTRACALQCAKTGFGIFTPDGDFLKFDAEGNARAVEMLKSLKKDSDVRVTVTGEVSGGILKVQTLEF